MKLNFTILQVLTCLTLVGCDDVETKNSIEYSNWDLPSGVVTIEKLPVNYTSTGTVVSDQRIEVSSRSIGYIREILVHEGEEVAKGELLIKLDSSDVEGAVTQAETELKTATLALQDANIDLQRFNDLYKNGNVSESQIRKMRLFRDSAQEARHKAQAALKTAHSQRQYISISSQIRGVVVARHHREGDLATPGKSILTIESTQGLLFETYVAESQISKIDRGDKVQVSIDALDLTLEGTVARVVPVGDPITRRYKVKIALPNETGLLSGMFGRVHFVLKTRDSPVIPRDALIKRGGLQGVFVIDEKNKAYFRWLQLGINNAENIEVRAGLLGGERIITAAHPPLREGDIITNSTQSNTHD
jgi:RND family efflux transporter MFP subunit